MKAAAFLAVGALALVGSVASAQDLDVDRTQTLDLTVTATDIFTISNTGSVTVSQAANNTPVTTSGGTYSVQTNAVLADAREIMVDIASAITGVTIELELAYNGANGTSAGFVTLTTTPTPAVTGIYASTASTQAITYRITVPPTVAAQANTQRVVTYTLIDTP
jgi:hypothetical protein